MLLGGELLVHDAPLRLADALDDYLLCSLSRNSAELLRLHGDLYRVAELCALGDLLCRLYVDLKGGVLDLFHGGLVDVHFYALSVLVKQDLNVVGTFGIVLAESRQHRLTDLVVHIVSGNSLFFFKVFDCGKEFSVHCLTPLVKNRIILKDAA